ncbi:MAG TPA: energy transducer TonB [Ideonella sp.]|nr:energy transducer TonB [Ideonella sp.]
MQFSPSGAPRSRRMVPFVLVCAVHVLVISMLSTTLQRSKETVIPPIMVSLTAETVAEPKPLPAVPPPKLPPLPRQEPIVPPPIVIAQPLEGAITLPPPTSAVEPLAEAAPTSPPAPPREQQAENKPVTPPRSDAAFLNNPAPVYPSVSRRLKEEGRVLFDVYILPDGSVGEIRLKRSSGHPRLDDAALAAVRQWRYVPAKRGDEPIPYWYVQPIDFALTS